MSETKITGGSKEFHYTDKDLEKIRNSDTPSTKEFKRGLNRFYKGKWKRVLFKWIIIVIIILLLILVVSQK